jgi:hypothetical protein
MGVVVVARDAAIDTKAQDQPAMKTTMVVMRRSRPADYQSLREE